MSIADIVKSMQARMPWPVGQKVLAENEIMRGHGWEKTIAKINENAEKLADKIPNLEIALRQHLLCGEKISTLFNVNADKLEQLRSSLPDTQIPKTVFSDGYPHVLGDTQLKGAPGGINLAAIETDDDGIGVVFSSVRTITVREPVDVSTISADAAKQFDQYEEILGLKTIRIHAYDIVWLAHDGTHIETRIDYPRGTPQDVAAAARVHVTHAFHKLISETLLIDPVNFFPLIDQIYNDPNEGVVVELGFGTTTASIKNEKMRRSMSDLRTEKYHIGGKEALATPIEPFRISVAWERPAANNIISTPELSINSSALAAGADTPSIDKIILRKCMGTADYEFIRSRIEHHLANASATGTET